MPIRQGTRLRRPRRRAYWFFFACWSPRSLHTGPLTRPDGPGNGDCRKAPGHDSVFTKNEGRRGGRGSQTNAAIIPVWTSYGMKWGATTCIEEIDFFLVDFWGTAGWEGTSAVRIDIKGLGGRYWVWARFRWLGRESSYLVGYESWLKYSRFKLVLWFNEKRDRTTHPTQSQCLAPFPAGFRFLFGAD